MVFGGVVFVLGGFVDNVPSSQILHVDVRTAQVAAAGSLPAPLDGRLRPLSSVESGTWSARRQPGRATTADVEVLKPR